MYDGGGERVYVCVRTLSVYLHINLIGPIIKLCSRSLQQGVYCRSVSVVRALQLKAQARRG